MASSGPLPPGNQMGAVAALIGSAELTREEFQELECILRRGKEDRKRQ